MAMGRNKTSTWVCRLLLAGWLPLLGGCIPSGGGQEASYELTPSSRMTSVSRVVMPVDGGQRIPVPRLMGDAYTLWAPLDGSVAPGGADGTAGARSSSPRPHTPSPEPLGRPSATAMATLHLPRYADDPAVRGYIQRMAQEQRHLTARVLERAAAHLPAILDELEKRNLPPELACLPLVESAYQPMAVSSMGAVGLWQLMPETARRFGLTVNNEQDDRLDVRKATRAAADYLAFLYKTFGDWPLALAAYNSGEGSMRRALSRTGTTTLAELATYSQAQGGLTRETLRFVPQFAAAVAVMTNSGDLGLAAINLVPSSSMALTSHSQASH